MQEPKKTGEADLSVVFDVAAKIGKELDGYTVVVTKSTVPVGTNQKVKEIILTNKNPKAMVDIASTPEFLREGQAISDTLHPDRIVIGTETEKARDLLLELHKPIDGNVVLTNVRTAEMIKYAANAFLATKISFANAIAHLSEITGADGLNVLRGIGYDKRIGSSFLSPGAGYGGSCFPKDVKALIAISKQSGYEFSLLQDVEEINRASMARIASKAKKLLEGSVKNKVVAILGLSFKPDTDDMRDAPSITVIKKLQEEQAIIKVYDPVAMMNARKIIKNVTFCEDAYSAIKNAEILIIMTEWNEFRQIDLVKVKKIMKNPILLDGRNIYEPEKARELGFVYQGVGR